jgi:hypothetical protein
MKRIGYNSLAFFAVIAAATIATSAHAISPNNVKFQLNNYNTCPGSPVTTVNSYPALVSIEHDLLICSGFAENHVWRFSEDGGATVAQIPNASDFSFASTIQLDGNWLSNPADPITQGGEVALNIAPWWDGAMQDGRVNCRVAGHWPDGSVAGTEVACFGGRMPFFSFTGSYGVAFVPGTPIRVQMTYHQGGLSALTPGRVQYDIVWLGTPYSSGTLLCDQGNPSEAGLHGLWGILDFANAGGVFQPRMTPGSFPGSDPAWEKATFTDISFNNEQPVATTKTSWGALKSLYR